MFIKTTVQEVRRAAPAQSVSHRLRLPPRPLRECNISENTLLLKNGTSQVKSARDKKVLKFNFTHDCMIFIDIKPILVV